MCVPGYDFLGMILGASSKRDFCVERYVFAYELTGSMLISI